MENDNLSIKPEVLVEQISQDIFDVWILDDFGEKIRRICGYPKSGVPKVLLNPDDLKRELVCNQAAGWGTVTTTGFCNHHIDKRLSHGAKNFYALAQIYAKSNTLSEILEDVDETEIDLSDVSGEIKMLSAMQLQLMKWIEEHKDEETGDAWTPQRISWMSSLLKDIVRMKETASRIEGSMRLDVSTLKQVVEMIMSFLMKELEAIGIPKDTIIELVQKMTDEVFIPMTNQALVSDKHNILQLRGMDG